MVLQHTAGCLPGVLVALPWVHPAVTREFSVSIHVFPPYCFLPRFRELSKPDHAVRLDLKAG